MSFTFAGLLKLRPWPGIQIVLGAIAVLILLDGLIPSVRYIYSKTKNPFGIRHYAQDEVAVSRFLKHVVAGQEHPGPPHLEHNEFNRIEGIPDAPYDTFICRGTLIQSFICFCMITMMPRFYPFVAEPVFYRHERAGCMERE